MKKLAVLSLVLYIMFGFAGCSSDNSSNGSSNETKQPEKTEFFIGDTQEVDGIKITVNSVRAVEGISFAEPDEGTKWIAIDVTFENTTKEDQYIGGIFELTLKDGDGREKEQNIFGELSGSVDGDVLAGEKLTGEKSFVVNVDETIVYLYYKTTWGSKTVKFTINLE